MKKNYYIKPKTRVIEVNVKTVICMTSNANELLPGGDIYPDEPPMPYDD